MKIIYNIINPPIKKFIYIENEKIKNKHCSYLYKIIQNDIQQNFNSNNYNNTITNTTIDINTIITNIIDTTNDTITNDIITDKNIFYLSYNNRLIPNSENVYINEYIDEYNNIDDKYNNKNDKSIEINIHIRQLGGGLGLGSLIKSIITIGSFFAKIPKIIAWFAEFIIWILKFITWIIVDLIPNACSDIINTIPSLCYQICMVPVTFITSILKMFSNRFLSFIFGSFWGWDNNQDDPRDINSNYFKQIKKNGSDGYKYYTPNNNSNIPFSVLLCTIILPPAGVFMEYGLTGWISILICTFLTFVYYIPGLLYALICLYC